MCVSSRRRPITSPPGRRHARAAERGRAAGRRAGTRRGCGSRARRRARAWRSRRRGRAPRSRRVQSTSAPSARSSSSIVSTSRMRGTFGRTTGSSVSRHAARIGSAPFLLPAARIRPGERVAALDDEGLGRRCPDGDRGHEGKCRPVGGLPCGTPPPWNPTREQAWDTLTRYTKSEALLRHALAVEASTALVRAPASARTRSSGASPRSCTTSTTRSTRRSTSIRRTARRSCARRATPRS